VGRAADASTWAPPVADVAVPLEELALHWRVSEAIVRCRRPQGFDDGWTLTGRVRGAFGYALIAGAEARPRSLRSLPVAYRLLFSLPPPAPASTGPFYVPPTRPFVLFATGAGAELMVTLRLYGYAAAWLLESRAALVAALRGGVSVAPGARARARLEVTGVETRQLPRPEVTPDPNEAMVVFDSPACFARGAAQAVGIETLLGSLFGRLAGLAAWHGIALDADHEALAEATERVRLDASRLRPAAWDRIAVAQGGRRIPMVGVLGSLWLSGPLGPLAPALALAPTAHLGSHTAFGMGRCQVILLD
jgi:hypothetical protein